MPFGRDLPVCPNRQFIDLTTSADQGPPLWAVLVQREVESARSLLASITSFRRASLGRHLPLRAGGGTGGGSCNWFQKEIRLGRPITSPHGWKTNWLRKT